MSELAVAHDDPTLPGRRRGLSTRSLRVVRDVAPLLEAAFALPDGPERDAALEAAIGRAIDAGRESGELLRAELDRLRGELADALQVKALLVERNGRLAAALDACRARERGA